MALSGNNKHIGKTQAKHFLIQPVRENGNCHTELAQAIGITQ